MFKRIDHIEIIPGNIERSVDFYVNILGFKIKNGHKVNVLPLKEVVYLELSDTVLELLAVESPADKSLESWQIGYRMMALEVEDMNKTVEYLKSKEIEPTWGPVDLGRSIRVEIKDPDGLSIELREWK